MRVLFATSRFPARSARGDQLRAYQQIRHLASRHRITLLTCEPAPRDHDSHAELAACCERVLVWPRSRWQTLIALLKAVLVGRPLQAALYDAWPAAPALRALRVEQEFDLLHVQMARLAGLQQQLRDMPCVIDMVDALSLNMQRRALVDRGGWRWLAGFEGPRLQRLERALAGAAARVVVSSPCDRDAIVGGHARVVANGVDLQKFPFVEYTSQRSNIVFSGNLGYFPNVDAARWFAVEVLPRIRAQRPQTELVLVGADPAPALHALARRGIGVRLQGRVDDMHPWLSAAAVAVAPMRAGAGQQIKMLEAMASGTPVVASTLAAAGLEAMAGEHLLVADGAEAQAVAVLRLLGDRQFAATMARMARSLIACQYSWERSAITLERAWLQAAAQSRHSGD